MREILNGVQDWLLQKGIDREIRQAGLTEDSLLLSFGQVNYLYRKNDGTPFTEAVLMLHGASSDKTSWVRFSKHLKADLPLLIPDFPGHGKSTSDLSLSYSIGAQVHRISEMLNALNIKCVHVVANSMGGAIAILLAANQPKLISSLVLIGTVGVQAKESWLQKHIKKTGYNPMIEIRNKRDYLAMMHIGMRKPPYIPGFILSALSRSYVSRQTINEKITREIELDLDQSKSLSKISCPVLIIWGSEDKVSDISNAELLHKKLASSQIEILDGVGHVPMVEAPKQVAVICTSFLSTANFKTEAINFT